MWSVDNEVDLTNVIRSIYFDKNKGEHQGACFILIKCAQGSRPNLGRPTIRANENKLNFMKMLEKNKSFALCRYIHVDNFLMST